MNTAPNTDTPLDLSIVVLNWNTSDLLNTVLQSVVSTIKDMSYMVTVIDNASTDGGFSLVHDEFLSHPLFSFVQNKTNEGWLAINRTLTETQSRYILTLDPDAILHKETIPNLRSFMDTHPQAGAATAKFLNPDGSPQLYYRRIMTPLFFFFTTIFGRVLDKYVFNLYFWNQYHYHTLDLQITSEVEQPAWPCLIWRREALGNYIVDTRLPFYFPDVEMSRRLYNRGYKIFLVSSATITHLKSTSYQKRQKVWRDREYYRSLRIYFYIHYPLVAPLVSLFALPDQFMRFFLYKVFEIIPSR